MRQVQVLVIGGGPGGATTAALLAESGVDVLLLERDIFPRYHIGESLLASCLPTLRLSGAFDEVAARGFQVKRGGLFHWAEDIWILDWARIVSEDAWSWQVDRADYDEILLRNAAKRGAEVVEGATVKRVAFDGDRPVSVEWTHRESPERVQRVAFDYLVDASGRAGVLSQQHLRMRTAHEVFQNVAVWSYWTGTRLLPDSPEGAVNVVSTPDGWWWSIPLVGKTSIGLVTHKKTFGETRPQFGSLEEYYLKKLNDKDTMRWITKQATMTEPVRAEQDYSYVSDRFCGPRYLIVGDAACFLDPLLSTGVHLAQYSAMLAAASILSVLGADLDETRAWEFFEYTYRRAYTRLLVLVSRLYRKYEGKDNYFWQSQRLVRPGTRAGEPVRSFTDIIAGLTDMREVSQLDTRVLTKALIEAAEAEQDVATANAPNGDLHTLDMSPAWSPWRGLESSETNVSGIYLVTSPRLGLKEHRAI